MSKAEMLARAMGAPVTSASAEPTPALQAQVSQSAQPLAPVTTTVDPETGQTVPYLTLPQRFAPVGAPTGGATVAPGVLPQPSQTPAPAAKPLLNLDTVMQGVWQTESGNRQHDGEGRTIRSPAGAIGVSQLMPGTASALGVDPFDETQNREGGKRYLAAQFEKYGNWQDALAAYNWGPENVDKWIAGGRDPAKMPEETRRYIPSVLSKLGDVSAIATEPTGSAKAQMLSRAMGGGAAAAEAGGVVSAEADTSGTSFAERMRRDIGEFAKERQDREGRPEDFVFGALRDAGRLITGPVQAGLQLAAPETAATFTNFANESEDRLRRLIGARDDKWTTTAGGLTGQTLAILGSAGALGTTAPAAWLSQHVPLVARMVGSGAALGGTQFHDKPAERSRVLEAAVGGSVGLLGAGVVKALQSAAQYASNRGAYDSFVDLLRKNTEAMTPSTSRLRDLFVENYGRTLDTQAQKFALYDKAGRALPHEFDREIMGAPAERAMQASREARMAPTPTTRAVAAQVDRELGGPEARATAGANKAAVREYEAALAEWQKTYSVRGAGGQSMPPEVVQRALQAQIERGNIPAPPAPPTIEEVPGVTPEQFGAAVQAIGRAFGKAAQSDRQTRQQLAAMTREMMDAARESAEAAGMNVDDFLRRMSEAREFHRKEVIPLRRAAGGYSPSELAAAAATPKALTPAKMYDRAAKLIEGHDMDALRAFKRTLGERGNDELVRVAAHRALSTVEEGKSVAEYIRKHDEALRVLLPREAMEELQGIAKISDSLFAGGGEGKSQSRLLRAFSHPFWAGLTILHGMSSGNPLAVAGGLAVLGFPAMRERVIGAVTKIKDAGMGPLLRRAAKLQPGSPAMDDLLATIARRAERTAAVASRVLSNAAGDNPVARAAVPAVTPSPEMRPVY